VPRSFTCIQAQNKIFLIGGELSENEIRTVVANDCLVLNEQTFEVERRAPMKYGKCGHQLAHFHRRYDYKTKDYIYAVGSKYPDDTNRKTEVYDIAKNKWFEVGELKQGRHFHSMCIVESRYLFVIAGRDSQTEAHLDSFEKLDCYADLDKQKWEAIQLNNKDNSWTARDTIGSFTCGNDGEILIFGGDQGWISDCYSFNSKNNEIERQDCPLKKPEEFFRAKAVHYNEKVFVVGCLDKDVHVYTPKVKKWFLLEKWFVDW
jgi:N-acetylneuraminic acid mutarotase